VFQTLSHFQGFFVPTGEIQVVYVECIALSIEPFNPLLECLFSVYRLPDCSYIPGSTSFEPQGKGLFSYAEPPFQLFHFDLTRWPSLLFIGLDFARLTGWVAI